MLCTLKSLWYIMNIWDIYVRNIEVQLWVHVCDYNHLIWVVQYFNVLVDRHDGPVWQLAWAHPMFGNLIASCSYDRKVIIWKETNGSWGKLYEYQNHDSSGIIDWQFVQKTFYCFFKNKKWNSNMLKSKVVKEFNFEMKEYVLTHFKKYFFGIYM